ncbi:MAG: ribosomal RNA small subunit methyltransferase A [Verrucomicrobia bacterium]|nr:ribosomal RNA small subunit methyltransferase A [Verrucomicrobiota bacterium]
MLYRPTELRALLDSLGVAPKKGLSQNFLIDGNILNKIAHLASLKPGDLVVEIGPGPGALTEKLLSCGCHVLAIEKDTTFARLAKEKEHPSLEVWCEDVLDFSFEEELSKRLRDGSKAKVVANIPYHLTTPILARLMKLSHLIECAVLMVQEEVARRCTGKDFSSFTIFLHYYSRPQYGFYVAPTCFYPAPKVGSSVIRLDLGKRYHVLDEEQFFVATRTAFCHRRKMLTSSLKELYPVAKIQGALESIGKSPLSRPEALSVEEWIAFFNTLNTSL